MKARILVAFLFITLVWGCKESPILGPDIIDPPVSFVTINASAGANGVIDPVGQAKVKVGESKIYKVVPNDGYTSLVTVDGVIQNLLMGNTFEVKTDNTSNIKEVKAEFILENLLILQKDIFYSKCINIRQGGEIVDFSFYTYPNIDKSDKCVFKKDGDFSVTDAIDGVTRTNHYELIDKTHMMIGSQFCTILLLNDKNLVYSVDGFYNRMPCTYEYNYWRP